MFDRVMGARLPATRRDLLVVENTTRKQQGGFKPGQSGNPAGKPKGARNRTTLAVEALLQGEATAITRKAIERAKAGDSVALRIVMDRICAPLRERRVSFDIPPVASAADLPFAQERIIGAVASGELSPSEGLTLSSIVLSAGKAFELGDFAARLAEIERRLGDAQHEP
jgi:Family of unknown function (DUF5681)